MSVPLANGAQRQPHQPLLHRCNTELARNPDQTPAFEMTGRFDNDVDSCCRPLWIDPATSLEMSTPLSCIGTKLRRAGGSGATDFDLENEERLQWSGRDLVQLYY